MARLGHTTPTMAMVYQHSLDGADARVANALSRLGIERASALEAAEEKAADRFLPREKS